MTIATTPLTYNAYIQQISTMAVVNVALVGGVMTGDAAWEVIVPQMLGYAELRIERDLDLLPLLTSNSYTLTPNVNLLQIPVGDFVTIQSVSVTGPNGNSPLLPVTKEFLQNVYGSTANAGLPMYFAMVGGDLAGAGTVYNNILVGPYPDTNYPVPVTGTIRMPTLYKNNTSPLAGTATTFISEYLPDLLIMASLIYISAFQRNFSKISDDPAMAMTHEAQYAALLKGAVVEEQRKRFAASGWSSMSPATIATPNRG